MILKQLELQDFRNHATLALSFDSRGAFFHGANGAGKTNVLEAIHFLAYAKSFRTHDAANAIRHERETAALSAVFDDDLGLEHGVSLVIGKKKTVSSTARN